MSASVSADGTTIGYDRYGDGPAMIMIGGAFQHRAIDPDTTGLAKRVAEAGFTVIDYDRRGRGESGDSTPYAVERELEDIAALVGLVGGRATLYGSSSGCAFALHAAAAGVGVDRLALWEPPFATGGSRGEGVANLAEMQRRIELGDRSGTVEWFMKDFPPPMVAEAKTGPMWPVMCEISRTLAYDTAALVRAETTDWSELWGGVDVPTLIMTGDPTLPIFAPAIAALAEVLPAATTVTIPGAAWHRWPLDPMAEQLIDFLSAAR